MYDWALIERRRKGLPPKRTPEWIANVLFVMLGTITLLVCFLLLITVVSRISKKETDTPTRSLIDILDSRLDSMDRAINASREVTE